MVFSRTQVDRLGERLRRGDVSDDDLRQLDVYRRSFAEPYAMVVAVLRDELGLTTTGRPAKSTKSLIDKLNRESARLSQVQDVAGCRVVTADVLEQDRVVEAIRARFGEVTVVDRRERPSSGYRAVHTVATVGDRRVEIQVRTALQHLWAELSEKMSDRFGIEIKYGGGDDRQRIDLELTSSLVTMFEEADRVLAQLTRVATTGLHPGFPDDIARTRTQRQLTLENARVMFQTLIARHTTPSP